MDIKAFKKLIRDMEENIIKLQEIGSKCSYINEKVYWDNLIWQEMYKKYLLESSLKNIGRAQILIEDNKRQEKVFTLEELGKYNGKNGMPAYIAVNGIVYDVTFQAAWAGGTHLGLTVGKDLSNEFSSCHNQQSILDKLQRVGILQK